MLKLRTATWQLKASVPGMDGAPRNGKIWQNDSKIRLRSGTLCVGRNKFENGQKCSSSSLQSPRVMLKTKGVIQHTVQSTNVGVRHEHFSKRLHLVSRVSDSHEPSITNGYNRKSVVFVWPHFRGNTTKNQLGRAQGNNLSAL